MLDCMSEVSVDRRGYVLTGEGTKLARVDDDGNLWVWDKRAKREIPLRYDVLAEMWASTTTHKEGASEPVQRSA